MPTYQFTYSSSIDSEDRMFADIEAVLCENDVHGSLRRRVLLTISEAFVNALVHGNKLCGEKAIKIVLDINEDGISADITDQGKGGVDKVENKRTPDLLATGGRGIDLIRHYSSSVRFVENSDGGLKVSISFDKIENKLGCSK